ncbi:MAG: hypothetical protein M1834_008776 [Cirrosporium novae-zelandiae]|nr:MAG: hypothetical protein M1834_008776 [Cirrosporium novae-zelandiae]
MATPQPLSLTPSGGMKTSQPSPKTPSSLSGSPPSEYPFPVLTKSTSGTFTARPQDERLLCGLCNKFAKRTYFSDQESKCIEFDLRPSLRICNFCKRRASRALDEEVLYDDC